MTMSTTNTTTTWNYRVVRIPHYNTENPPKWATGYEMDYEIRQVYYEDGVAVSCGDGSYAPYGETPRELRKDLKMMKKALEKPILDYNTLKEIPQG